MKLYVNNSSLLNENFSCISHYQYNNLNGYLFQNNTDSYFYYYDDLLADYRTESLSNIPLSSSCINDLELVNNVYYRKDLSDIMIIFFIITLVCFFFPYKIFARAFGRWFKI